MSKVLVIGAGGVGSVAVHKMAMNPHIFEHISLASRTKSKCDAIAAEVLARTGRTIATAKVDADNAEETAALITAGRASCDALRDGVFPLGALPAPPAPHRHHLSLFSHDHEPEPVTQVSDRGDGP